MKLKDIKYTSLLILLLLPVYSRGLFEIIFTKKTLPYLIQFAALLGFVGYLLKNSSLIIKRKQSDTVIFLLLFLLSVITSGALTTALTGEFSEVFFFSGIIFFLVFLFALMFLLQLKDRSIARNIQRAITMIGIILFAAGTIEQLFNHLVLAGTSESINFFPGHGSHSNIIRPASLTGSMLHYPIIMPVIGIITFRYSKSKLAKIFGLIFLTVPFFTFSRSGIVISSVIVFLFLFEKFCSSIKRIIRGNAQQLKKLLIISASFVFLLLIALITVSSSHNLSVYFSSMFERIFAFQDTGNSIRYRVWETILYYFSQSNLLLGEFTGMASNTVRNIFGHSRLIDNSPFLIGVPESGALQILTSYGIIGFITYYGVFLSTASYLFFEMKERLLTYALLGVIAQTLFYQSTEVFPFVFTVALIPLMAGNLEKSSPDPSLPIN